MQKLKFLSLPDNIFIIFIPLLFISFPLFSYELTDNDALYFQTINNNNYDNLEIIDNLTQSALSGSRAIRLQSALTLSRLGLNEFEDYRMVSKVCTYLLDDGFIDLVLLENLFDSYYLQEDYENLILAVNRYVASNSVDTSLKINFYSFLAKIYEDNSTGIEDFKELLVENSSSESTENAYNYIKELEINLPESISILADFKSYFYRGKYLSAGSSMIALLKIQKEIIEETLSRGYIVDNIILSPVILDEMYKTASASGRRGDYLHILEEILVYPENSGYEPGEVYSYEFITGLYETAGYLKRVTGNYAGAAEMFLKGLPYASGRKYEKLLWYWYNSLIRDSPETAVSQIGLLTQKWTDPDYFTDVLSELSTYCVQQGQWTVIKKILDVIELSGPDESISKYAYISARAGLESYIDINKEEITRLMTLSYDTGFGIASGLYYRILAGNYLKIFDIRKLPWMFNTTVSRNPVPLSSGIDGSAELVFGWLEYGFIKKAFNYLMDNPFSDFNLVRRTALALSENNSYAESIRLLNRYSRIDGFNLNIGDLKLIYPDAYNNEILKISEKETLEWYVFTALLREESHFQEKVVSSAGAIGLSQLMPPTAADVAERLRFSSYNLKDAYINLTFGGWYLGNLTKRTDILSDALFAYNGGLTRVRRWRSEYSDLPDDLFLEAIPFKETSHYGRKLLVSSVIYGYLYDGIQPNNIISLFYRNQL